LKSKEIARIKGHITEEPNLSGIVGVCHVHICDHLTFAPGSSHTRKHESVLPNDLFFFFSWALLANNGGGDCYVDGVDTWDTSVIAVMLDLVCFSSF
jgi:hypothetical protein